MALQLGPRGWQIRTEADALVALKILLGMAGPGPLSTVLLRAYPRIDFTSAEGWVQLHIHAYGVKIGTEAADQIQRAVDRYMRRFAEVLKEAGLPAFEMSLRVRPGSIDINLDPAKLCNGLANLSKSVKTKTQAVIVLTGLLGFFGIAGGIYAERELMKYYTLQAEMVHDQELTKRCTAMLESRNHRIDVAEKMQADTYGVLVKLGNQGPGLADAEHKAATSAGGKAVAAQQELMNEVTKNATKVQLGILHLSEEETALLKECAHRFPGP